MSDVLPAAETVTATPPDVPGRRRTLAALWRRKVAVAGMVVLALVLVVALGAGWVAPFDPHAQNLANTLVPPLWDSAGSWEHPLGTDALGRDVLSRLLHGARNSLLIAFSAMLIGSTLGLVAGVVSGFFGGKVDSVIMRLGEVQLAFPFILLAIALLGLIPGRGPIHLILVLGIPGWIVYARVVRSRVLSEREKEHVAAATALGASKKRRLARYVFPSVWQVVPVIAMLDVGFLVIMESTLSFLGLGLPPRFPSWGAILAEGRRNMLLSPWLPILPGLAIMLTVLSINLTADGLADVLDPRLRKGTFRRITLRLPASEVAPRGLLSVSDLNVEFPVGGKVIKAVRGVGFDLRRGETLGIVGETGSGKSVTALSIIGLLDSPGRITSGSVLFDGEDLARISNRRMNQLRGRRLGMIFQNPAASLNPVFSIGFQMTEALRHYGKVERGNEMAEAQWALTAVGIGDPDRVMSQHPFQLSGGMNQRVMIAMAMSAGPDLLIADEPTTALDVTTQAQILSRLGELTRDNNTSVILISHDIALVAQYADKIAVMYAGRICELGPAQEVISFPRHPYTKALLESVPRTDLPEGAKLEAIPGDLPDPAAIPPGCPFAERCPRVMDVCRRVDPVAFQVGRNHEVACHLWSPERVEVRVS